jgi:hypothetical protein
MVLEMLMMGFLCCVVILLAGPFGPRFALTRSWTH